MSPMPILGYRVMSLINGEFRSLTTDYVWLPNSNIASCKYRQYPFPSRHPSPYKRCTCGFYAYHILGQALVGYTGDLVAADLIIVAVIGRGKTFVYHEGWRSEFMTVVGVLQSRYASGAVSRMASKYFGVPLLRQRALERYSLEHAEHYFRGGEPFAGAIFGNPPISIPYRPRGIDLFLIDDLLDSIESDILNGRTYPQTKTIACLKSLSMVGYSIYGRKSRIELEDLRGWCFSEMRRVGLVSANFNDLIPERDFRSFGNPLIEGAARTGILVQLQSRERWLLLKLYGIGVPSLPIGKIALLANTSPSEIRDWKRKIERRLSKFVKTQGEFM